MEFRVIMPPIVLQAGSFLAKRSNRSKKMLGWCWWATTEGTRRWILTRRALLIPRAGMSLVLHFRSQRSTISQSSIRMAILEKVASWMPLAPLRISRRTASDRMVWLEWEIAHITWQWWLRSRWTQLAISDKVPKWKGTLEATTSSSRSRACNSAKQSTNQACWQASNALWTNRTVAAHEW